MSAQADITPLRPAADSPEARRTAISENVVATLERLLARAKSGDVQGVAVALVTDEGICEALWTDYDDNIAMLAGVAMLRAKFERFMLDELAEPVMAEPTP